MRDDLTCWDYVPEFTGQQAALAIVGEPNTEDSAKLKNAMPVLDLMRRAYEGTRRWFADAPEHDDTAPRGLLVSVEMQAARGRTDAALEAVAGDFLFLTWLRTTRADFDLQTFTREVLARWVHEVGASSVYAFTGPLVPSITSRPFQHQAAAPEPVVDSQEQRQAGRWQLCIDSGLTMPTDTYSRFPRGIGRVAKGLGITRQALQQDLNAYRERIFGK